MKLKLVSWNSNNINDGTVFNSYIPPGQLANLITNPVTVNRADDFPFLSTRVLQPHTFQIGIQIAQGYNNNSGREKLKEYFDITDSQRHNLIAEDQDNSNKQYYLTGFPIRIVSENNSQNNFGVTLQVEFPYWKEVTESVDSWDVSSSSDSDVIANNGNINVPPKFTITPYSAKTKGLKYRRFVRINFPFSAPSFSLPVDITNNSFDAASLVISGKLQTGGNDLYVWNNGNFIDRYLSEDPSSDSNDIVRIWSNISFPSQKSCYINGDGMSDSSVDTVVLDDVPASIEFLKYMKNVNYCAFTIESEIIKFDKDNIDIPNLSITGLIRGANGSTSASHSGGQAAFHLSNDLWILYGDSDLTTEPSINEDYSPMFSYWDSDCTNLNWVYDYSFWGKDYINAPGSWYPEVTSTKTGLSHIYTADEDTFDAIAEELGLAMINAPDFQIPNEAAELSWSLYHPLGFSEVTYSGKVYSGQGSWPGTVGFQYNETMLGWQTPYTDSDFPPSSSDSWVSIGPHTISLSTNPKEIRFVMQGQLNSVINDSAKAQFDTVYLDAIWETSPYHMLLPEEEVNLLDFRITNSTTGEFIECTAPCPIGTSLIIDCENKMAYTDDGSIVNITLSSNRKDWLDLIPGNNTIVFSDDGTTGNIIDISHRDRIL